MPPVNKVALRNILLSLIESDLKNAEALREILERVKTALSDREIESLQALLESQQPILASMHQNAKQRTDILRKMGLQDNAEQWQKVLEKFDLLDAWKPLRKTLKRCDDLNQINQRVISRNRHSIGRLIDIVRGEYGQPTLYNSDGDTRSKGNRGRTISTA